MRRVWRLVRITALLGAMVGLEAQAAAVLSSAPASVRASIIASVGRQLDPDFPTSSVSLEPSLGYTTRALGFFRARTLLDRPLDPYKPWRAPFAELLGIVPLHQSERFDHSLFFQTSGQDIHQWNSEGMQVRQAVGWLGTWRVFPGFSAELSLGPFSALNEFDKRRNGDPFSRAGVLEQLSLTYQWGPMKLEILALVVQDWNGRWRNLYTTFERLSVRLARDFSFGVTHQLLRSHMDEVSGSLQPVGVFDGRKSRIAGFLLWQI
jgi:hypothetical protein